jgi:hypothetical protein
MVGAFAERDPVDYCLAIRRSSRPGETAYDHGIRSVDRKPRLVHNSFGDQV